VSTKIGNDSLHPWLLAVAKQPAKVAGAINPLLAALVVAGFPITSLESGTPLAAIWKRAVFGQVVDEVVRRLAHVVYSVAPSVE
jgi:hypothetical protein